MPAPRGPEGLIAPQLEPEHDLVLCVSGGKDSSAMALWLRYESGLTNSMTLAWTDTGHEHPYTVDHVHKLADKLDMPLNVVQGPYKFLTLCESRRRFPAPKVRFCTEELKVRPMSEFLEEEYGHGRLDRPVLCLGIRREESDNRAQAPVWDRNNKPGYRKVFDCPVWRPILDWTAGEVFAMHARHSFEPNPLYKLGAKRVGCFPCIFSSKADLRACFELDPSLLGRLRHYEARVRAASSSGNASFFSSNKVPPYMHDRSGVAKDGTPYTYASIDAVYDWIMRDDRVFDEVEPGAGCWSHYGLCE